MKYHVFTGRGLPRQLGQASSVEHRLSPSPDCLPFAASGRAKDPERWVLGCRGSREGTGLGCSWLPGTDLGLGRGRMGALGGYGASGTQPKETHWPVRPGADAQPRWHPLTESANSHRVSSLCQTLGIRWKETGSCRLEFQPLLEQALVLLCYLIKLSCSCTMVGLRHSLSFFFFF